MISTPAKIVISRMGLSAVPRTSLPQLTRPAGSNRMINSPTAATTELVGAITQAIRSATASPTSPATTPARRAHQVVDGSAEGAILGSASTAGLVAMNQ